MSDAGKFVADIVRALKAGDVQGAERLVLEAGGPFFAFTLGYETLDEIFSSAPEGIAQESEIFLVAMCLSLVKHGRARRAKALLYDEERSFTPSYIFVLTELMVHIHLGERVSKKQLRAWEQLEGRLPLGEHLFSGLYYNSMLVVYGRLNMISEARMIGAQALETYEKAKQPYLQFFIHLHLADLAIIEGKLRQAKQHLKAAERFFKIANICISSEKELIEALWLTIDFEAGEFAHIPERAAKIRQALVDGDSWSEIFIEVSRIGALSIYFLEGRKKAIAFLQECQVDFHRRHGDFSLAIEAIQAHIEHIDGLQDQANYFLYDLDKAAMYSPTGIVISETMSLKLNPEKVLDKFSIDERNVRSNVMSELARAAVAQSEKQRSKMRQHVENAMRIAAHENLASIFLEYREVVSKVSSQLATGKFARGHKRLAYFAKQVHRIIRKSYIAPKEFQKYNMSAQQLRILNALQDGGSNKKIAVNLGLTEAAVKYHLTNLFKIFNARSRGELIETIDKISNNEKSYTFKS